METHCSPLIDWAGIKLFHVGGVGEFEFGDFAQHMVDHLRGGLNLGRVGRGNRQQHVGDIFAFAAAVAGDGHRRHAIVAGIVQRRHHIGTVAGRTPP